MSRLRQYSFYHCQQKASFPFRVNAGALHKMQMPGYAIQPNYAAYHRGT